MTLVRQGVRALLSGVEDVRVVGDAATAEDAIRLARELRPDAVLIDQDLPGGDETARAIKAALPDVGVIVMTNRVDQLKAVEAIEAGAKGYVLKDISLLNLTAALRTVRLGRPVFYPEVSYEQKARLLHPQRRRRFRKQLAAGGLTPRERAILIELSGGSTDQQVATRLGVTTGTVKTHIRNILGKLDCRNRTHAVVTGLRQGIIS